MEFKRNCIFFNCCKLQLSIYYTESSMHHLMRCTCLESLLYTNFALLAGAVEYTNCFSAEEKDTLNECPGYDTKQSDAEVPVMLEL